MDFKDSFQDVSGSAGHSSLHRRGKAGLPNKETIWRQDSSG